MVRIRRGLLGCVVLTLVVAGCGLTSKSSSDEGFNPATASTFAPTSTTLPMSQRLLAVANLPGSWVDAGGLNYASVYGDQPQRCFYDLDQLDSGAVSNSSAAFRGQTGAPVISEVIFNFQPGGGKPAVDTVAKDMDGCGAFSLGAVAGSVTPVQLGLHDLDDAHAYLVEFHNSSQGVGGLFVIGRQNDSVLLVILGAGPTPITKDTARRLFQLAVDKFTTGTVHNETKETA